MAHGRTPSLNPEQLRDELEQEVLAMSLQLAGDGGGLPEELLPALRRLDEGEHPPIEALAAAHAALAELVHPARPQTLALLSRTTGSSTIVNVPIIRRMLAVAIGSMLATVIIGMSPDVTLDSMTGNPLTSSGVPFLVNQLYFMATAALGAAFHGLTALNRGITEGTYDPRSDSAYWTRLVLGIISGTILSSLLEAPEGDNLQQVGRNVLALLGGYSAGLVHRLLDRLVTSVESIFGADARPATDAGRMQAMQVMMRSNRSSLMAMGSGRPAEERRKEAAAETDDEVASERPVRPRKSDEPAAIAAAPEPVATPIVVPVPIVAPAPTSAPSVVPTPIVAPAPSVVPTPGLVADAGVQPGYSSVAQAPVYAPEAAPLQAAPMYVQDPMAAPAQVPPASTYVG